MKIKNYIFLAIVFFSQQLFSSEPLPILPNGLDCYIRTELNYFDSNNYNSVSFFNLHIGLSANVLKLAVLKFSYGFSNYVEEYSGLTSSVIVEKEIYKNYKLLVGVNHHFNAGVAHGTEAYVESYSKTFLSYIIGCGINLSKSTSFDLQFYIPKVNEYGYSFYNSNQKFYNSRFILKFGFEYSFNLIR